MDKIIFLLISCFFAFIANAQPIFFSSPKQPSSSEAASGQAPVLTPTEFNAKVSEISTKNMATMKQKIEEEVAKVPPPVVPKVEIPKAVPEQGKASKMFAPEDESISDVETQAEKPKPSSKKPAAALAPPPEIQQEAPPESYSTTPTPTKNGEDSHTFTGFGTGTGTSGTSAPQNNKGGGSGWNIKY